MKRLRNGVDQQDRFAKIWRFELQGALTAGGSATAKRLDWDGSALASSTDTFTLYAPLLEQAESGTQGYAIFCYDSGRWEALKFFFRGLYQGILKADFDDGDTTVTCDNVHPTDGGPSCLTDPTSTTETVTLHNTGKFSGATGNIVYFRWNYYTNQAEIYDTPCP